MNNGCGPFLNNETMPDYPGLCIDDVYVCVCVVCVWLGTTDKEERGVSLFKEKNPILRKGKVMSLLN